MFGIKEMWTETKFLLNYTFEIKCEIDKQDKDFPLIEFEELLVMLIQSQQHYGYETLTYIIRKGTSTVDV